MTAGGGGGSSDCLGVFSCAGGGDLLSNQDVKQFRRESHTYTLEYLVVLTCSSISSGGGGPTGSNCTDRSCGRGATLYGGGATGVGAYCTGTPGTKYQGM